MSLEIRELRLEDAEGLLDYFRELVRTDPERVERPDDADKITLESQRAWIARRQQAQATGEMFAACALVDGKIVAEGEVERAKRWIERHVAEIRFGVLPVHAAQVAPQLVEVLVVRARDAGLEVLTYFHLETQTRGLGVMRSSGFDAAGRIPRYYKRGAEYVDRIYLVRVLG
jgi:hypothetical protein